MQHPATATETGPAGDPQPGEAAPEPAYWLFARALSVWLLLLVAAFFNGAFRDLALMPLIGEGVSEVGGVVMLGVVIVLAGWWLVATTPARHPPGTWFAIGALWAGLTLAFEFGFFRYVLGVPWNDLLADYDPRQGGYFAFIILVAFLAPPALATLRGARVEP